MTAQHIWKILHILSLFLYAGGLGGVLLPVFSGWTHKDVRFQAAAFQQAADSETAVLLPGILLTGLTGVFWAASSGYSYIHNLWLLLLSLLYLFSVFICLPLWALVFGGPGCSPSGPKKRENNGRAAGDAQRQRSNRLRDPDGVAASRDGLVGDLQAIMNAGMIGLRPSPIRRTRPKLIAGSHLRVRTKRSMMIGSTGA